MTDPASKTRQHCLLALLLAAWMLPGLLGRDPWKADEAYTFGLVQHIIETGDHLVPTLAGEPFMQKPPLFFSTAAVFVKAFGSVLGFGNAARLANVFFLVVTLISLGLAGRIILGKGRGWLAPVLFMGTIGQVHITHMLITDVSLVCGFAIALHGLLLWQNKPLRAGIITGTGLGVAFMSKGLIGPGLLGLAMLLLPVCFRQWRSKNYFICFGIAFVASLPWALIWPVLLYQRSPELFGAWFLENNLSRFIGHNAVNQIGALLHIAAIKSDNTIGMRDERYLAFMDFPWFAFPATLLAVFAFWKNWRTTLARPGVQLALMNTLIILAVVTASRNGRSLYILPVLVPATLLGITGFEAITESFAKITRRVCFIGFGFIFAVAWIGWIAQITGQPAPLWNFIYQKLPTFMPQFQTVPFISALLFTVLWIVWMSGKTNLSRDHAALHWTAGIAGIYLFLMTLWLPALESRMSYAHLASLKNALPADHGCIASLHLGEPQRAMFDFYAGVKTRRLDLEARDEIMTVKNDDGEKRKHVTVYPEFNCQWFLTEEELFNKSHRDTQPPSGNWELVWENIHSGKEVFRLYRRKP